MRTTSNWGVKLAPAICEYCDWHYLLPQGQLPQQCPHCFKINLTALDETTDNLLVAHPPEQLLPFTVSARTLSWNLEQFVSGLWFAPGDFTLANLESRLQPVYLPMWLVDSQVQARWQAEVGFDYEVVSHRDSFNENSGQWQSEELIETRIRWEPRVGRLTREYDNIPAPALEEHADLLREVGQYDIESSQPYRAEALAKKGVRLPNRTPTDAWPDAVPAFQTLAVEECRQAAGADHIREFRWSAEYKKRNWTLLLLPLYTTYYLDDNQYPQPVLIHGQTGRVSGVKQASMQRAQRMALIIVAIAVAIFIPSLLLAVASIFVPSLLIVAGLGIVVALIVGMLAVVPMVLVWKFNRPTELA